MTDEPGGYAVCRVSYTPADPLLKRFDAPSFRCGLPYEHKEMHCVEVAPGLLFRWSSGGGSRLQWTQRRAEPVRGDDYIDIVFDGPPGPVSGRFIEVENPSGRSIRVGEWVEREDGFSALRIPCALTREPEPDGGGEPDAEMEEWADLAAKARKSWTEDENAASNATPESQASETVHLTPADINAMDDARWDASVEQIHREMAGEVEPPEPTQDYGRILDPRHEGLGIAAGPTQEPVAWDGRNMLHDPTEIATHVKRLRSLAEAVRVASKRLPDTPVSAEVVACAGIMGMANWLDDVASLLASPPVAQEDEKPEDDWDNEDYVRGWQDARAGAVDGRSRGPCPGCASGDVPVLLDMDGTKSSVSGRPGILGHGVGDRWWYCEDYAGVAQEREPGRHHDTHDHAFLPPSGLYCAICGMDAEAHVPHGATDFTEKP